MSYHEVCLSDFRMIVLFPAPLYCEKCNGEAIDIIMESNRFPSEGEEIYCTNCGACYIVVADGIKFINEYERV